MESLYALLLNFFLALFPGVLPAVPPTDAASEVVSYATTTGNVVAVIDGDTIDVQLTSTPGTTRVRYIGIDTPEPVPGGTPECGSADATEANRALMEGKHITIVPGLDPEDDYGRMLAYVYVDGVFVNESLVRNGFARLMMISPNLDFETQFRDLETQARQAVVGNWHTCKWR